MDRRVRLVGLKPQVHSVRNVSAKIHDAVHVGIVEPAINECGGSGESENHPRDIVFQVAEAPVVQNSATHGVQVVGRDKTELSS